VCTLNNFPTEKKLNTQHGQIFNYIYVVVVLGEGSKNSPLHHSNKKNPPSHKSNLRGEFTTFSKMKLRT